MRFFIPRLLLALAAVSPVLARPECARPEDLEKDVLKHSSGAAPKAVPVEAAGGSTDPKSDSKSSPDSLPKGEDSSKSDGKGDKTVDGTVFNGETVPPMKELRGDQFKTEIKDGYW